MAPVPRSQLDHHCPWTGKCIGKYNLAYFYGFLTTLSLLLVFTIICSFVYTVNPH